VKSFVPGFMTGIQISPSLLKTVRLLGEYKGKETLYKSQIPQALDSLQKAAIIQSTESSNRIEGVTAPLERIQMLVADKTSPRNRSEQEILGYREVLGVIHASYLDIPRSTGVVLQFHRDLFKYSASEGGRWKPVDNEITEIRSDGTRIVRFTPVPAHAVADSMRALQDQLELAWHSDEVDKLILIPLYILDFLCIHPFLDGNGRMARLLTLLLLYRAGYEVGRYISLEKLIEDTRESYYDALYRSSQGWHESAHSPLPWIEYLLGILTAGYREFEQRVGMLQAVRGAKTEMVLRAVNLLPDGFRMVDLERMCPAVTREMIRVVLNRLKKEGKIRAEGAGPAAVWRKVVISHQ
jgi:Fic family protein